MSDLAARVGAALADRYAIERELGQGGMATVYLAQDLKHGRKVAVKVLKPELAATLGAERFLREIGIAARLTHPHILPLHDSGQAGGFIYYVMPYVEGQSLRERLVREGELPVADVVRLLTEVVDALAYAHKAGVVHRDIKPDNILISGRHASVTDFGVAKAVSEATGERKVTTTGVALGTPAYMAPEQAAADQTVDHRADIYAVGAMAYELLTGKPPFEGPSQRVLAAHVTENPKPVSEHRQAIPPALAAMVMKCLEKRPADRWQSADEMHAVLESLATPSGGITPTDTLPVRAATMRRPRGLSLVAIFVIVGAIGAGVWYAWIHRAPAAPPRLLAVPFENRTGDSTAKIWGELAAEWITREVERAAIMDVTSAASVRAAIRDSSAGKNATNVTALAARLGASTGITGTYERAGPNVRFEVEIVDAAGRLTASLDPVSGPADSVEAVIATLTDRVLGALGARARGWTGNFPPSLAVFRELEASGDLYCLQRYADALVHAERALALAPTSPSVVGQFAGIESNLGHRERADSFAKVTAAMGDRLGPMGKAGAEYQSARFASNRDHSAELRAGAEVWRLGAREIQASDVGVFVALNNNLPRLAIERFRDLPATTDPCARDWAPYWGRLSGAYHMVGDYRAAVDANRRGRVAVPRLSVTYAIEALAALDRPTEVDSLLETTRLQTPNALGGQLINAGLEFRAHGDTTSARREIDRAVAWYAALPQDRRNPETLAFTLYYAGRFGDALKLLDSLVPADTSSINRLGLMGATLARLGNPERASAIDAKLAGMKRPYLWGSNTLWRARIAAIQGDADAAAQLFNQALREGLDFGIFFHRDPYFESIRQTPVFKEVLRPKG